MVTYFNTANEIVKWLNEVYFQSFTVLYKSTTMLYPVNYRICAKVLIKSPQDCDHITKQTINQSQLLKWKWRFDEIFVTSCIGSCHFDNYHWWKFYQNEGTSVSVTWLFHIEAGTKWWLTYWRVYASLGLNELMPLSLTHNKSTGSSLDIVILSQPNPMVIIARNCFFL